jgi:hypothetical protein
MDANRTVTAIALLTLAVFAVAPIAAKAPAVPAEPPLSTAFEVYVYACQPVEYDFAGAMPPLSEAAVSVHDELFANYYGNSCRDFYYGEIAWRLVPPGPGVTLARR